MAKRNDAVLYDLIPSQNAMYYMFKFSLHKNVMQIPTSIKADQKLDIEAMKKAFAIEVQRNDCMRLRFTMTANGIKQHFLPSAPVKEIPVVSFSSDEEEEAYLTADAQKSVRFLRGETFRFIIFNDKDGNTGIYFNVSHIIMDALGIGIFYADLFAVYDAVLNGKELPPPMAKYEDAIKNDLAYLKNEKKYEKDKQFFVDYWSNHGKPFYAGVHGPELLLQQREKYHEPDLRVPDAYDLIHDKCDIVRHHVAPEQAQKIFNFCRETKNAPENVLLLGLRTHCSAINFRTDDTLQIVMCSRRATLDTKRMSGCLAQPLQLHTVIPEDKTFKQALEIMFSVRTQLYRRADFPYMHARKLQMDILNYRNSQGPSCMMFTWLPLAFPDYNGIHFEFRSHNPGRYIMPMYVFAVPTLQDGGMDMYYLYRTNYITPEHIRALHDNAIKVITEGIDDPDITVAQLLDSIS
ncbi:MAG: hypothetical protein IJK89_04875 [Clostridia bacterium]|nr:hypothetical protein [Clostridia bacterium]